MGCCSAPNNIPFDKEALVHPLNQRHHQLITPFSLASLGSSAQQAKYGNDKALKMRRLEGRLIEQRWSKFHLVIEMELCPSLLLSLIINLHTFQVDLQVPLKTKLNKNTKQNSSTNAYISKKAPSLTYQKKKTHQNKHVERCTKDRHQKI